MIPKEMKAAFVVNVILFVWGAILMKDLIVGVAVINFMIMSCTTHILEKIEASK